MKKFRFIAIAAIGFATFAAFKSTAGTIRTPTQYGWFTAGGHGGCRVQLLDFLGTCDKYWTGPICTAGAGYLAYDNYVGCDERDPSQILRRQF